MALPKIQSPVYEIVIPSTQDKISVRSFLVKEEKILLMALQGGDTDEMTRATKQIINNCVVSPDFDIDKLEIYDLEYILLQLRICSQGETTKIKFLAREGTECPECTKPRLVEINLRDAKIVSNPKHTKKIQLTDTVGVIMRCPNAKMLVAIESSKASKNIEDAFKVIWMCVESVYDNDKLYKASEVSIEEGLALLESLRSDQFVKIEEFFSTLPKLKQTVHVKCGLCPFEQDYTLEGLESFFG